MHGALQGGDACRQFVQPLLQIRQDLLRVLIRAGARTLGIRFRLSHDGLGARLRGFDHFAHVRQAQGFFFCHLHNAVRFFFGLRENAVFFLRDATRLFDFFGHGNAQLVNDVETFVFVNHPLVAKGHCGAFVDGGFKPIYQVENIYGDQPLSVHRKGGAVLQRARRTCAAR